MRKRKIIIDCDPGIDDTMALMLALSSPELEIVGITTVCGNVPVEKGAYNVLKVLAMYDRLDIPVYVGAATPLEKEYIDAMDTHGEDGLGESNYPIVHQDLIKEDATAFIGATLKKAQEQGEKISIIALGPLTNIAHLIQRYPETLSAIDEFVCMGGSYKSHGNCSPVAEYNFWCDPHAADLVFQHLFVHMIGLDVTREIVLTPNILSYMERISPEKATFIRNITQFYFDFHWHQEGVIGCVINDPLAVAYFIDRSLCQGFDSHVRVETEGISQGQSLVDRFNIWQKEPNAHILEETSPYRFMQFYFDRVLSVPYEETEKVLPQILVP